ncbi:MAG: hypothetical protein AAB897_02030 [Patescibacteria group bacterium]
MNSTTTRTIKAQTDQMNFEFLQGMVNRMDVSFFKYGEFRGNYRGQYSEEFLRDLAKHLRALVKKWKGGGTTANGNAIMFALERLLLYVAGGEVKGGTVPRGNTEYLMDFDNGGMIEFTCPQVPQATFAATDDDKSPGFSGLSKKEAEEFERENQ